MARTNFSRSSFRPVQRAQKRKSTWLFVGLSQSILPSVGSAAVVASLNAAALALRPFTVVRSRLYAHIDSDQQAAGENYTGAVGIAVVSDQALAIGITAVPTPVTDAGSDLWFLHQWMIGALTFSSAVGLDANAGVGMNIDSKAMRKVDVGQDLIVVVERGDILGGAAITVAGRILVKLH